MLSQGKSLLLPSVNIVCQSCTLSTYSMRLQQQKLDHRLMQESTSRVFSQCIPHIKPESGTHMCWLWRRKENYSVIIAQQTYLYITIFFHSPLPLVVLHSRIKPTSHSTLLIWFVTNKDVVVVASIYIMVLAWLLISITLISTIKTMR